MYTNLTPDEERLLVQRAQRDPAAIRDIYRHYHPRIYAYVAHRVGRKQDAEDIVSDSFMRAVGALPQFEYRGAGALSAWLFQIARNEIRRFYGKHNRWQQQSVDIPIDELPNIASEHLPPDQQFLAKERYADLRRRIEGLSSRRKEIVQLRFFGGLRNQEIAEVLELDERTVASHLCRAIDDLRRDYDYEFVEREEDNRHAE